jgi:hypothetical protein
LAEIQKNTWRKNRGPDEQTQLERLLNMLSILRIELSKDSVILNAAGFSMEMQCKITTE